MCFSPVGRIIKTSWRNLLKVYGKRTSSRIADLKSNSDIPRLIYSKMIIQPLVDKLDDVTETSKQLLEKLIQKADDVFKTEKQEFERILIDELSRLLKELGVEEQDVLKMLLGIKADTERKIAQELVNQKTIDGMQIIQKWVVKRNKEIEVYFHWRKCYRCVDSICGWLLLTSVVVDPHCATGGSNRVVRGGSWDDFGQFVRSAFRFHLSPGVIRTANHSWLRM